MVFIFVGIFFALIANIYWYKIKDILKRNGFKVYLFSHLDDLGNFQHLVNKTEDIEMKAKYKKILFKLRISMVLAVIRTFVLFLIPHVYQKKC